MLRFLCNAGRSHINKKGFQRIYLRIIKKKTFLFVPIKSASLYLNQSLRMFTSLSVSLRFHEHWLRSRMCVYCISCMCVCGSTCDDIRNDDIRLSSVESLIEIQELLRSEVKHFLPISCCKTLKKKAIK